MATGYSAFVWDVCVFICVYERLRDSEIPHLMLLPYFSPFLIY